MQELFFYGYGLIGIDKERIIAAVKRRKHKEEVIMIRNRSKRYTDYPIFEKKYKPILLLEFKSCLIKQYGNDYKKRIKRIIAII